MPGSCSGSKFWMSCLQMSIPQVKSLYQSSAHINQPCAPGSVSASCHLSHLV